MSQFGVLVEGYLDYPLKKLDNGFVVPDVSLSEIHKCHQEQIRKQIELSVYAEKLGYDYVLQSENHFHLMGANSPTPLQTQIAIAERTEEIRLMQMANILPWHQPVRLAERIGMLDIVSDGRVEVGVGTGSGAREGEVFTQHLDVSTVDDETNWEWFRDRYETLLAAWTEDLVEYHGGTHDVPPENVEWENDQEYHYFKEDESADPNDYMKVEDGTTVLKSMPVFPQPVQEPHPQVWRPSGTLDSVEWSARHGVNGCAFCTSFSDVKDFVDCYYETAEAAGWPDRRDEYDGEPFRYGWDERRRRGLVAQVPIFNTEIGDEAAFERWKLGQEFVVCTIKSGLPPEQSKKIPIGVETKIEGTDPPLVGDSEEIIDALDAFKDICGYEDFMVIPLFASPGMTHEDKRKQLRGFSETVMPYFED